MSQFDLDHQFSLENLKAKVLGQPARVLEIGRYRILSRLGKGAFGVVFEVEDVESGERLALKTLRTNPEFDVTRLIREFRLVSEVRHENLVRLYSLHTHERPYIVMELVHGRDLASDLQSLASRAEWDAFSSRLRQVGAGLAALHARGIVHHDIKPSNVLVTNEGRVVILDFGLGRSELTSGDVPIGGTLPYMAPERLSDDSVGPSADMYGVGLIAAMACVHPWQFQPNPDVAQVLDDLPASMPPGLRDQIVALCSSQPDARPSAEELAGEMADVFSEPGFVGRQLELDAILRAASDLAKFPVMVVEGDSGSGKTTLVGEAVRQLGLRGYVCGRGRCHEREQMPFGGFDQIVGDVGTHLATLREPDRSHIMADEGSVLAAMFPTFGSIVGASQDVPSGTLDETDGSLKHVLDRLGRRERVVIWLDDIQWLNGDSARLLLRLLRQPERPKMMVILGVRPSDSPRSGPCVALLEHLNASEEVSHLRLERLHDDDAASLVRQSRVDSSDERVAAIVDESRGNPYLLIELSRSEGRTPTAKHLFESRTRVLDDETRRVLQVIAACNGPVSFDVAVAAGKAGQHRTRVLDSLVASKLIVSNDLNRTAPVDCSHARVRDAVLNTVSDREGIHAAITLALVERKVDDSAMIAWHAHRGEMAEVARRHGAAAAREAMDGGAFERAAEFWGIARSHANTSADQREYTLSRARAWSRARRCHLAGEEYLAAAAMHDGDRRVFASVQASREYFTAGDLERARTILSGCFPDLAQTFKRPRWVNFAKLLATRVRTSFRKLALSSARAQPSPRELSRSNAYWYASLGTVHADLASAGYLTSKSVDLALALGEPRHVARALALDCVILTGPGGVRTRKIERFMERARQLAERCEDQYTSAIVQLYVAISQMNLGLWERAVNEARTAESKLRDGSGSALELQFADTTMLNCWRMQGRWRPYVQRSDEALDRALAADNPKVRSDMRAWSFLTCLVRDDPRGAHREIEAIDAEIPLGRFSHHQVARDHTLMRVLMYEGEYERAFEHFEAACRRTRASGWWHLQQIRMDALLSWARVTAALYARERSSAMKGRTRAALATLQKETFPGTSGQIAMIEAMLARVDGDEARAHGLLVQAEAEFERRGLHLELMGARQGLVELSPSTDAAGRREWVTAYVLESGIVAPERLRRVVFPEVCRA